MEFKYLSILISLLLGVFSIQYIRRFDIFEQEPFHKMIGAVIVGGAVSIFLSLYLYLSVHGFGLETKENFFSAFFIIGPVEEFAKLGAFILLYYWLKNELNEPVDYLIYMSCVALGFSLIENYFYANRQSGLQFLIFLRLLSSTPAHIAISAVMGLSVFLWQERGSKITTVLGAFVYASMLHGAYDFLIFIRLGGLVFLVLMAIYWKQLFSFFSYLTAISHLNTLTEFIRTFEPGQLKENIQCLSCDNLDPKAEYQLGKLHFYKCKDCAKFVISRASLFMLFHYFTGNYESLDNSYKKGKKGKYYSLFSGNYIYDEYKFGYFDEKETNDIIKIERNKIIFKFENSFVAKYFLGIRPTSPAGS